MWLHTTKEIGVFAYHINIKKNSNTEIIRCLLIQDLKKVLPDITYGEEGKMSVDYHGLLMVAINTIKELEARIKALEEAWAEQET